MVQTVPPAMRSLVDQTTHSLCSAGYNYYCCMTNNVCVVGVELVAMKSKSSETFEAEQS